MDGVTGSNLNAIHDIRRRFIFGKVTLEPDKAWEADDGHHHGIKEQFKLKQNAVKSIKWN